jgi:hypothetical protein
MRNVSRIFVEKITEFISNRNIDNEKSVKFKMCCSYRDYLIYRRNTRRRAEDITVVFRLMVLSAVQYSHRR